MNAGAPLTWSAAERAARASYGRLVARLAYRFGDVAAAEDALADALERALTRWPVEGVPDAPEAWLATVAKNRLLERARHRDMTERHQRDLVDVLSATASNDETRMGDDRLRLLFVCAHPAIDPAVRTPLMLQTVLGLDAAQIASAFVVSPTTMGQRLVRAKRKIHEAKIPFDVPEHSALAERLDAVLEAIYAAFTTSLNGDGEAHSDASSLAEEAIFLAEMLRVLLPNEPEVLALLALMQLSHARRRARADDGGRFVPLGAQDTSRWDRDAILRANETLLEASAFRRPGAFQLEAAIQSAHCQRLFTGATPWRAIAMLYDALNRFAATLATRVAQAAVLVELSDFENAARVLADIDVREAARYQPYWVTTAELALRQGDIASARSAMANAIELTESPALRAYLEARIWTE